MRAKVLRFASLLCSARDRRGGQTVSGGWVKLQILLPFGEIQARDIVICSGIWPRGVGNELLVLVRTLLVSVAETGTWGQMLRMLFGMK